MFGSRFDWGWLVLWCLTHLRLFLSQTVYEGREVFLASYDHDKQSWLQPARLMLQFRWLWIQPGSSRCVKRDRCNPSRFGKGRWGAAEAATPINLSLLRSYWGTDWSTQSCRSLVIITHLILAISLHAETHPPRTESAARRTNHCFVLQCEIASFVG